MQEPVEDTVPRRDPYPRMIIVCIGISAVLFILLSAVLLFDFLLRARNETPIVPSSQAFFEEAAQEDL